LNGAKDTFFRTSYSLRLRGEIVELNTPKVMGILNVTPNSFYDGGKHHDQFLMQAEKMINEGVFIIDVGGASTKPGAETPSLQDELETVIPVIEQIRKTFPETYLSVDTYRAEVAKQAVVAGADIVNDVSAGRIDPDLLQTVADLKIPYVLMHMQGDPATMQDNPTYDNVTQDVIFELSEVLGRLRKMGVADVIIDPGFGFGKSVEHNFQLLRELKHFQLFNVPILAGLSRKSMINKVLGTSPQNALNGTSALNTIALMNGAKLLRVHDVKEAMQCIQLVEQYEQVNE
jgi:dihydropteroate synthase